MISVRSNISVLKSVGHIQKSTKTLTSSVNQVSTGKRINSAADDGAGNSVAVRMEADISSTSQAQRNINDGISYVQTIEGSLETATNIITRLRELSVQAANETYTSSDRTMILAEMTQQYNEFQRLRQSAQYNGVNYLNSNDTIAFQVGKDGSANDQMSLNLRDVSLRITTMGTAGSNIGATVVGGTAANRSVAVANLALLDSTLNTLSGSRATVGSLQNRMETALTENSSNNLNMQAAQGRILDADYASQTTQMTRSQMQLQAGIASLAQAKSMPQGVLGLLN